MVTYTVARRMNSRCVMQIQQLSTEWLCTTGHEDWLGLVSAVKTHGQFKG